MTLTDFLLTRIAEDESAARACGGAPWVAHVHSMVHVDPAAIREEKWRFGSMGYVATVEHDYDREHMARHDPARVLAECEAKRRMVSRAQAYAEQLEQGAAPSTARWSEWDLAMRYLALPHADHPDYRPEWRP